MCIRDSSISAVAMAGTTILANVTAHVMKVLILTSPNYMMTGTAQAYPIELGVSSLPCNLHCFAKMTTKNLICALGG